MRNLPASRNHHDTTTPSRRRRPISKGEVIYVLCFAAIVVALLYVRTAFPSLIGRTGHHPSAAHLPRHSTSAIGPFSFLATTPSGRPVTYDPCHPIHYVIDPTGTPTGGMSLIRDGIRAISAASGLRFIEDGLTHERPDLMSRPALEPQRYGQSRPPVLIAWADETEYPLLHGDIAGVGGSTSVQPDGPESARYVTGQVVLDREDITTILPRDDGYAEARAVVMHELGHLVGLGHVNDPDELMAQLNTGQLDLGPGDRQGLAEAGEGPCWPDT